MCNSSKYANFLLFSLISDKKNTGEAIWMARFFFQPDYNGLAKFAFRDTPSGTPPA